MADLTDLQKLLDHEGGALGVPGAAVGVIHCGDRHVLTTGVNSVDAPAPVTADTLFQIGSTTKTVTATVIMHLVERGELRLDGRVREYLPDFRLADEAAADAVTIEHLLTHTGGFLGDIDDGLSWGPSALADAIAAYAELPQLFAPGSIASYSNAGFRLLGRIAEVVSGLAYEEVVRRVVLEPLGMTSSFFFPWEAATRPHAVGHVADESGPRVAHTWGLYREAMPEGGLLSSVTDQLRYAAFHLEGAGAGQAPLTRETRALMQRDRVACGVPWKAIGLPWLIDERAGLRLVTHGGSIGNIQVSAFVLAPEHGFAVTVLANAGAGKRLGELVLGWCLEHLLGAAQEEAVLALSQDPPAREYDGGYYAGQWTFQVRAEGARLRVRMELDEELVAAGIPALPELELAFLASERDTVVIVADPARPAGRFLRDDSGRIAFLHLGGRAAQRL
ncbi:serine hydrolase domain-containing protein [Nonomuraea sp. NPDC049152]|uniref:serine hydrolase domain-containing protein n=1 Tax=Nonomuraea sp. NPDC049152 TaxID=3154350 RepID=UPI0033C2B396